MRFLLVEDDRRIAKNVAELLRMKGHVIDTINNGEDGLYQAEVQDYDLIILDWMLPDISGLEICKRLRKKNVSSPILMLTAKSQTEDIVEGLETGADDYLTKPFAAEVLIARINSLLRRKIGESSTAILKLKHLVMDTNKNQVMIHNKLVELAPKEYALLEYLMMNRCKCVNRMEILEHVWGETIDEFSNTVDVHIRYLRKKIDEPNRTRYIKTVKNKGYMICDS